MCTFVLVQTFVNFARNFMEAMIKRVSIFCASSYRVDEHYLNEAYKLGRLLAENDIEIIYGGGRRGLMGSVSSGSLEANGIVIGVIPEFMKSLELGRQDIQELRVVDTMHQREEQLINDSDLIICLPGGIGTFEELTQAIAWKTLGLIIKPILIVNMNNYFEHLLKAFDKALEEKFMKEEHRELWQVVDNVDEVISEIKRINSK